VLSLMLITIISIYREGRSCSIVLFHDCAADQHLEHPVDRFVITSIVPTARFAQPIGAIILYPMIAVSGSSCP